MLQCTLQRMLQRMLQCMLQCVNSNKMLALMFVAVYVVACVEVGASSMGSDVLTSTC